MKNRSQHTLLVTEREDLREDLKDKNIQDITLKDLKSSLNNDVIAATLVVFQDKHGRKVLKDREGFVGEGYIYRDTEPTEPQKDNTK